MRPSERLVFDFETNAWVRADAFSKRAVGHEVRPLDAPATAPSEGRWNRPEAAKGGAPVAAVLLVWSAVGFVVAAIVVQSLALVFPALLAAVVGVAVNETEKNGDYRVTNADRMLMEDPDDRDVCLVRLTVVRDGKVAGKDKGVVWFADGLLLYSGHRTSFAIGGEDVLPQDRWNWVVTRAEYGLTDHCVPLRVPKGSAYVTLLAMLPNSPHAMRLLKRLYAFRRRPPQSRGPRQWPPLEP